MKKILQIPNYQYPNIGGIEQVARDIANAIKSLDVDQKMICFNEDAQDGDYICKRKETVHDEVDEVEVIRCGCFAKVASQSLSLTYPWKLHQVLKGFQPDIVVLHYPNPFVSSFFLPMLPKKTKFILYWHLDITKQTKLRKLFHHQTNALLKRADIVVATSPNYVEGSPYLKEYRDKCIVIPNAISEDRLCVSEKIAAKAEEIRKAYPEKCICFAVGRHVEYKGIEYLVKASKLLDDRFAVLIGGKGPLTEELKAMAAGDAKVEFLGRVSDEDLVAYYQACDLLCFPSITKNEAFGISLAEGMYFEKPAVTFTIDGSGVNYVNLKDVTGLEVANRDVEAYAQAMVQLHEDVSLSKRYGEQGKLRVIENFTAQKFSDNVCALITKFC